jgi:hypothetical protein
MNYGKIRYIVVIPLLQYFLHIMLLSQVNLSSNQNVRLIVPLPQNAVSFPDLPKLSYSSHGEQ